MSADSNRLMMNDIQHLTLWFPGRWTKRSRVEVLRALLAQTKPVPVPKRRRQKRSLRHVA